MQIVQTVRSCTHIVLLLLWLKLHLFVTGTESAAVQRPGSGDIEEMSEKDQREASPLIDAFDLTLVC